MLRYELFIINIKRRSTELAFKSVSSIEKSNILLLFLIIEYFIHKHACVYNGAYPTPTGYYGNAGSVIF